MGVPAFFRYMSEKYPKIIEHLIEDRGTKDIDQPLPQYESHGYEFDNLYIDLNGIIHPCAHPEDRKAPSSEIEMYQNVTVYIDRLFAAVRPKKLLFLAIDGVAPRAKMNQQRSRRFRAAQDAAEKNAIMSDIKKDLGFDDDLTKKSSTSSEWDSNVITPGTPFMHRLADYLRSYIVERINNGGPAWRNVTVLFSDASEPGEGEHKIMSYIREQRATKGYNPNLRHILHGLDADLIMLGLATHEAHFTILREEVLFGRDQHSQSAASKAQDNFDLLKNNGGVNALQAHVKWCYLKPLVMCQIPVLREYLAVEFSCLTTKLSFGFDFERIIDDFVFLCFFVGNDFLPHLPTLDIRDGAIDFLFNVYKRVLPTLGDYLTMPGGDVNLEHVDIILGEVGAIEDEVFQRRKGAEDAEKMRQIQRKAKNKTFGKQNDSFTKHALIASGDLSSAAAIGGNKNNQNSNNQAPNHQVSNDSNKNAAQNLKAALLANSPRNSSKESEVHSEVIFDGSSSSSMTADVMDHTNEIDEEEKKKKQTLAVEEKYKAKSQAMLDEYRDKIEDEVRFWQAGWKNRYYADKYKDRDITKGGGREKVFKEYITGLCWVMKYYYSGCPSWKWYYPFHYAPFASDLRNIEQYKITFDQVGPFHPIEQLMAVLPKESHQALPKPCHNLMLLESSPIADFYPHEVEIDPNGKAMPWLWVALLPFIDEERLLYELNKVYKEFDEESNDRNCFRISTLFVHKDHPELGPIISNIHNEELLKSKTESKSIEMIKKKNDDEKDGEMIKEINCNENTMAGSIIIPNRHLEPKAYKCHIRHDKTQIAISQSFEQSLMIENKVLSVGFKGPKILPHVSSLLLNAVLPQPKLSIYDMNIKIPRLNRGLNISDLGSGLMEEKNQYNYHNQQFHGHGKGKGGGGNGQFNNFFNQQQQYQQHQQSYGGGGKGGKGTYNHLNPSSYQQQQSYGLPQARGGHYHGGQQWGGKGSGKGGGREGGGYQFQRPQPYDQQGKGGGGYQHQQQGKGGGGYQHQQQQGKGGGGYQHQQQYHHQGGGGGGGGGYNNQPHSQYNNYNQGQGGGGHQQQSQQPPRPPGGLDTLRMGLAQTLAKRGGSSGQR